MMVNYLNKCFVEREVTGLSQVLAETKDKFFGPSSALPDRNSRGLVIQDVALGYEKPHWGSIRSPRAGVWTE